MVNNVEVDLLLESSLLILMYFLRQGSPARSSAPLRSAKYHFEACEECLPLAK